MSDSQKFNSLPVGVSSFTTIRAAGLTYVDKTALLYQMACRSGAKVFLVRPRRFGKSLLVSTLATLFRDGLQWFEGLAIAKMWNDTQYKVLTLDFSKMRIFSTLEEFLKKFRNSLNTAFSRDGFDFIISSDEDIIDAFNRFLSQNQNIVLLIDEYDAPLNTNLDNIKLFTQVRDILSNFYDIIKSNDICFRFIFITGILKLHHTRIFSSFNNLDDISLSPEYGTLLGYTNEEIEFYFSPYLIRAAELLKMTKDEIVNSMQKEYDGFCFDRLCSSHVYAPWSVLKFLQDPKSGFVNYWYSSGGKPIILMNNLSKIQTFIDIYSNKDVTIPLNILEISNDISSLDNKLLLLSSGYLTIKKIYNIDGNDFAILNYPNIEVKKSFPILLLERITGINNTYYIHTDIRKALVEDNIKEIFKILNSIFTSIHYGAYPVKDESTCRAMLQIFMKGLDFSLTVERGNAFGRSDIEVLYKNSVWVFEIKFLKGVATPLKIKALLQKAVEQMQSNHYGEGLGYKKIRRLALVFSDQQRALVGCKLDHSTLTQA